jgi:thiol-disulfide isomerase/thioredoxin
LPALTLVLVAAGLLTSFGCDQERKAPPAPQARNIAVQGSGSATPSASAAQPAPRPPIAKREGPLCGGKLAPEGRDMPASDISRASAPGVAEPEAKLRVGAGKWTWVNFWAAWCVPCKEEIPRLKSWEQRLNQEGTPFRLVFVSLDDDARQLQEFLKTQPADGLRSSYWLREGEEREDWLKAAGADPDPELPAHLLVDPRGKVRCVVAGAVGDGDYAQLKRLLAG